LIKALDLFCGVGGVSVGLFNSGFEVVGVDINDQPNYPFKFINKSVFDLDLKFMAEFDLIHASPPCQAYLDGNQNNSRNHPKLIEPVRKLLDDIGKPYIIENVELAPIRHDLMLCGEMFQLKVLRHRFFEIQGFHVPQLKHIKHNGTVAKGDYVGVYSGSIPNDVLRKKYGPIKFSLNQRKQAMNIHWAKNLKELFEAIPPKYYEYIGKQFIKPTTTLLTI